MAPRFQHFHDLDDLRNYVNSTLCNHYQLQIDAFQMTERVIRRSGVACGIYFSLQGPRAVQFTAIWETDRNQILFYGASGERILKTQLTDAPSLEAANRELVAA